MFSRRIFLAMTLAMGACTSVPRDVAFPADTTLIIYRHADREGENLSDTGRARAQAFADALKGKKIEAIFAPGIQRNLDTAAPLAQASGLDIQRIPQENPTAQLMQQGAGKTIVWIGNKGNLRQIWLDLGAQDPPPLAYGDLFTVTRGPGGIPRIDRARVDP